MKYPFQPEILDALPEELAELFRSLENTLLEEICSRLKIADNLNEVTVQDIRALRALGIDLDDIKKAISETSNVGMDKLNKLLDDVVERNQAYYSELVDLAKITMPEHLVNAADIDAIRRQTQDEFTNITKSMGFLLTKGGQKVMLPPAKAYQWALDNAEVQIMSGGISYREAIKNAVKQLADSGIKTVDYESGHVDQIDVSVRRAVMTGVNQLCDKYTVQAMEYLGTDYCEVSAHIGARDVEGRSPWSSHKKWQGRVYSTKAGDKYPNVYEVCGLGYVDGLEGANCRHKRFPYIEGVSERTYTDDQLEHIDDGYGCEYQGKYYTAYEATQQQRKIERTVRKLERLKVGYQANEQTETAQDVSIRIRRLKTEYKNFSKAAGLPEQPERMKVSYIKEPTKIVEKPLTRDTMVRTELNGGVPVNTIGRIDVEKFKVVSDKITTDEVVITDERIQHIKERHPNDYERFVSYIPDILADPDYIIEANKDNTAVLLKEISGKAEKFKLILRLKVPSDPEGYKNSILTFWKIGETTWKKMLKNKNILYKKE